MPTETPYQDCDQRAYSYRLCYWSVSFPCTPQAFLLLCASSHGKTHGIGFIVVFTSLPALLSRIMLRHRDRRPHKMGRTVGEVAEGKAQHRELLTGSSARGSRSFRANHGSSLQGCSFFISTKLFKRTP